MKKYIYIIMCLFLAGCSEEEWDMLTPEVQALLGKAVNFSATVVDEFKETTRATYNDTGVFNENDMMRIYRQYAADNTSETIDSDHDGWDDKEAYRTYYFNTKYATGTSISLGTDWKVWKDRKGLGKVVNDAEDFTNTFTQTEADSITWENGKTVRFRSWARSNYANALSGCYKYASGITNYYPDFCISDWATVSGPTSQIPLTLRHICSRIAISYRNNGSQFYKVELATEWQDYMRQDNADTGEHDNGETEKGKGEARAKAECNEVLAVYNRMCMPAGVDIDKSELYAMTQTFWNDAVNDAGKSTCQKLIYLENEDPSTFYHFGKNDNDYIKDNVQRPIFGNVNQSCYLVTIPYDMSNEGTQGDVITLPACTRFRVYMRDVNNGDGTPTTGDYEGTYHIFSLSDIVDASGQKMFPHGLDMLPGYSYKFYVGYRYNQLTITANDNFSWTEQDLEAAQMTEDVQVVPETPTSGYSWWKTTIKNAIPTSSGGDFNPVFHITDEQEFIEFIKLVNGTAATATEGLYRANRVKKGDAGINPDHADNEYDKYYWWYNAVSDNKRDTTWVNSAKATELGYLLYQSYHAANGNQPAYSQEEYVRGAYPFYDMTRDRHYTVYLDNDLDLADWELPSIGNTEETPFMGYFDGQMHTIKNLNMKDEYLFKYIDAAAIRNLKIESTHKVSLIKEGINTCYIVGVDIRAHSTLNSIAEKLTSNQYNNPSYVVGCIHVGDAGGALVGTSSNLYMYGCMQAAEGIPLGQGALMNTHSRYSAESTWKFFTPLIKYDYTKASGTGTPSWGRFMCNYFDTTLSPNTWAVGDISLSRSQDYSPLEYIRGRESFILKAKNDNLLKGDVSFSALNSVDRRLAYYGLAPWKAMNYGIYRYNQTAIGGTHKCNAHYVNSSTGYVHKYPELQSGEPTAEQYDNTLEQKN